MHKINYTQRASVRNVASSIGLFMGFSVQMGFDGLPLIEQNGRVNVP
jgi:hypothetical protein